MGESSTNARNVLRSQLFRAVVSKSRTHTHERTAQDELLANLTEERPNLLDVKIGLFKRGEVTASVKFVPVADIGVIALGPTSRCRENLFRKL